jgi:hypothetical protein
MALFRTAYFFPLNFDQLTKSIISIDLPPSLVNAPSFTIQSTEPNFDCSKYANYPTFISSPGLAHVSVSCTGEYGSSGSDPSGGGGDNSGDNSGGSSDNNDSISSASGPHLPARIIAGIAVSSASFVLSLFVTACLCIRSRNRRRKKEADLHAMQADDLAWGPPIHQCAPEPNHIQPPQSSTGGGEGAGFSAVPRGAADLISPVSPLSPRPVELQGKEIYEVLSPVAITSVTSEMPSEKSQLFYNKHAVAEKVSREEALAARERAVEARERRLNALPAQRHDRYEPI